MPECRNPPEACKACRASVAGTAGDSGAGRGGSDTELRNRRQTGCSREWPPAGPAASPCRSEGGGRISLLRKRFRSVLRAGHLAGFQAVQSRLQALLQGKSHSRIVRSVNLKATADSARGMHTAGVKRPSCQATALGAQRSWNMKTRTLGKSGMTVSAIGMGCMGFSHGYGAAPDEGEAIRLIRRTYELGCTFFDTAEGYGPYVNEELVGKAVAPFRDRIVLATKVSPVVLAGQDMPEGKLSRKGIRRALEDSLRRLGTDYVDLYYQHRVPEGSHVEDVALWMGELIREGKIRGWGQSQSSEEQIRRAHAVTPITAIQSEYSMMERMFEKDVIPACEELGIGFVPFSPLASGFLSGKYGRETVYAGDDVRRVITRFARENVEANQPLLDLLQRFAREKAATPAQIALAWMLHKKAFIVPVPGMRREERIVENLGAAEVTLTPEEFCALERELDGIVIHGNRTDKDIERLGTVKAQ